MPLILWKNYMICHLIHWECWLGNNYFTYDNCNDFRYWISATNEAWELSTMAHKINSILDLLKKQLTLCHQYIGQTTNPFQIYGSKCCTANVNTNEMDFKSDKGLLFDADDKRNAETFQMLLNLFESIHIDNMKILRALISPKDDVQPLLEGSTKRRVHSPNTSLHYCIGSSTIP